MTPLNVKKSQLHLFTSPQPGAGSFDALCQTFKVAEESGWIDSFGQALSAWARKNVRNRIKTLSLFSGAGGLDIAFHDAGFDVLCMVEIEEQFIETLRSNTGPGRFFGNATPVCSDIRNFSPKTDMQVDFIIGGPPCQTFSAAGRRAAGVQGTQDHRGTLFEEYVRILSLLKPRGFLFENVYGITGAEGGKAWEKICAAFRSAGYTVHSRILDSADYGVPQHRERLFIVGVRDGEYQFPQPTHGPDSPDNRPYYTAGEAVAGVTLSDKEANAKVGGRFGHLLDQVPPSLNYSFFTEQMGHPKPIFAWRSKFSDFLYKATPDAPTRTLKAQGGQYTGPFHWDSRPFALGELKRLQTFPDSYMLTGGHQGAIHQLGNSVPPQIGRILALTILNQVFSVDLPVPLPLLESHEQLGFRQRKRSLTKVYRARAQMAIQSEKQTKRSVSIPQSSHNYYATLSKDFAWTPAQKSVGAVSVSCRLTKGVWRVHVRKPNERNAEVFRIEVTSSPPTQWVLGKAQVILSGSSSTREVFTGVWKAFEAELSRSHVKADLVQLCGYYQYRPAFSCAMKLSAKSVPWEWRTLVHVVEGRGVAEILPASELANLYELPQHKVLPFAVWLRSLGYEIRNKKTNPQIPEGYFLIPYSFPTLVPLSVQLRKSLLGSS